MILIGNPENRRITMFQDALIRLGRPPATLVSWHDLLMRKIDLSKKIESGQTVRIESPGENFEVERELLRLGFEGAEAEGVASIAPKQIDKLPYDRGRILYPRQWYHGFSKVLTEINTTVRFRQGVFMNAPEEIRQMFDKPQTHRSCTEAAIPVPEAISDVSSFDQVLAEMESRNWKRVFIKPANGSSASGVGAFYYSKETMRLTTTVEIEYCNEYNGAECRLYNSLKIRTYTQHRVIADVIDELCRHRIHVERWLPKAAQHGHQFDLRRVSIAGKPMHGVVRLGRSPITNLHLGNRRGDFELLKETLGPERCEEMDRVCRQVAARFSRSHVIGIDLLATPHFREFYVLELNAFGDLLPGIHCEGRDTYETEILSWKNPAETCFSSDHHLE